MWIFYVRLQITGYFSKQADLVLVTLQLGVVEDGRIEIDNNLIENSIRPLALGRKNYLFARSHKGAQRAAMTYSFFASCKYAGVNPWEWLSDVLGRIGARPVNRLKELLPGPWTKNQEADL